MYTALTLVEKGGEESIKEQQPKGDDAGIEPSVGDQEVQVRFDRAAHVFYGAESFDALNDKRKEAIRGAHEAFKMGFDEWIRRQREQYGPRLTPPRKR